jgi:hypothetical protein
MIDFTFFFFAGKLTNCIVAQAIKILAISVFLLK